jgi:hypothetical protein
VQGLRYSPELWNRYEKKIHHPVKKVCKTWAFSCQLDEEDWIKVVTQRLRWSRGSVLPLSTKVRGFKPGRSRRIFQGKKILSTPSFGREVKPSVPCRRFAPCKSSLNGTWKSTFRQNYRLTFSPTVPPFAARISRVVWMCGHLVAEVEMSKPWGGGLRVAQ